MAQYPRSHLRGFIISSVFLQATANTASVKQTTANDNPYHITQATLLDRQKHKELKKIAHKYTQNHQWNMSEM
jgi:hypothetical protein